MKKFFISLLLFCVSISAYADNFDERALKQLEEKTGWKFIKVKESPHAFIFANKNRIKDVGNHRQAWILVSYNEEQTDSHPDTKYHSVAAFMKYDCKNEMASLAAVVTYEEPMGKGKIVGNESLDDNFAHVPPDSSGEAVLNYVCSYRIKK